MYSQSTDSIFDTLLIDYTLFNQLIVIDGLPDNIVIDRLYYKSID